MFSFLPRLHPLVVHLPIGLLSFAFLLSLMPSGRRARYEPALTLSLAIAGVSSLLACVSGYLLKRSDSYEELLSSRHQWVGIATCVVCFAALAWLAWRRPLVWLASALMVVAGHLGGTMTHGEGYLFATGWEEAVDTSLAAAPADSSVPAIVDNSVTVNPYRDQVAPILRTKCEGCHSSVKRKGGLRLDGEDWIRKGGENGKVLSPGDPMGSPLYAHLVRPMDDDLHMPPKGKRQLTKAEIAVIHRWVASGAPFGDIPRASMDTLLPDESSSASVEVGEGETGGGEPPPPPPALPKADVAAVTGLRMRGAVVQEVMTGSNGLYVSLVQATAVDDSLLLLLGMIREQAIEVRAPGLEWGDARFLSLPAFPNLRRLDLSRTRLTDAGLQHMERFPALEVLNLYGTQVGDGIAESLAPCRRLRKVFLWRTAVTDAGLRRLRVGFPSLQADDGRQASVSNTETK
ncbi:MAG: hypothetical protein EBZ67_13505 [Chitinophagia bacterium]|nr:hypothetical protein [Chitinophagia bacterium]